MTNFPLQEKKTLLSMAKTLKNDTQDIQQRGAGYYSCGPFVNRYNKLLAKARQLFSEDQTILLDSFEELEDTRSVDPSDKIKVTQRVLIELGQLVSFMESVIHQEEEYRRELAQREEAQEKSPKTEQDKESGEGS